MTSAAAELQQAQQRAIALRREADLAAALVPTLAEQALAESREIAARDNSAELAMTEELPQWQERYRAAYDAARDALAELVAVSKAYNARVDRFHVESAPGPNPRALAGRGPVQHVTTGLNVLRLAADAIRTDPTAGHIAAAWAVDIDRTAVDARPFPRCVLDPS